MINIKFNVIHEDYKAMDITKLLRKKEIMVWNIHEIIGKMEDYPSYMIDMINSGIDRLSDASPDQIKKLIALYLDFNSNKDFTIKNYSSKTLNILTIQLINHAIDKNYFCDSYLHIIIEHCINYIRFDYQEATKKIGKDKAND